MNLDGKRRAIVSPNALNISKLNPIQDETRSFSSVGSR